MAASSCLWLLSALFSCRRRSVLSFSFSLSCSFVAETEEDRDETLSSAAVCSVRSCKYLCDISDSCSSTSATFFCHLRAASLCSCSAWCSCCCCCCTDSEPSLAITSSISASRCCSSFCLIATSFAPNSALSLACTLSFHAALSIASLSFCSSTALALLLCSSLTASACMTFSSVTRSLSLLLFSSSCCRSVAVSLRTTASVRSLSLPSSSVKRSRCCSICLSYRSIVCRSLSEACSRWRDSSISFSLKYVSFRADKTCSCSNRSVSTRCCKACLCLSSCLLRSSLWEWINRCISGSRPLIVLALICLVFSCR
mmetsp:Transcript_36602/g.71827  ORF Transcript_36602/g.71827 Transcript_36602/m.71827 type:complete len:313 (-) Transcript_36602:445-1383(-)